MRSFMVALAGICCFLNSAYGDCTWSGLFDNFDAWVLGAYEPELRAGQRGDGTYGAYIHIPVGTSPFYSLPLDGTEGGFTFWINDPGNCTGSPDPGYPAAGPRWGLRTLSGAVVAVGIWRNTTTGCGGYYGWSSVAPDTYIPFKSSLRSTVDGRDWSPGWYKWTVDGSEWSEISFTIHDVTYEVDDAAPHDDLAFGDWTVTYDETTGDGAWDLALYDGWESFYAQGDASGGVEPVDLQIVQAHGDFIDICYDDFGSPTYLPSRSDMTRAGACYTGSVPGATGSDLIVLGEHPAGMILDEDNQLQWTPAPDDTGTHMISAAVMTLISQHPSLLYITVTAGTVPVTVRGTQNAKNGIRLSCNPFRDAITVTAPNAMQRVDIFDADGILVHSTRPRTARFTWGTGAPVGVYTLRATTDSGTYVKSIVKYGK